MGRPLGYGRGTPRPDLEKEFMMSIRLTVQLSIKAGKASEFAEATAAALERVRADDAGCEMYDLFKSCDDDTRFVMVESWTTEADLKAHGKSAAMGEIVKAFGEYLAGAPVIHKYEA
ncbi:MAG: putative quinol monooxygenase [Myxococcota bacterium]